jgi:hypothetical protein
MPHKSLIKILEIKCPKTDRYFKLDCTAKGEESIKEKCI